MARWRGGGEKVAVPTAKCRSIQALRNSRFHKPSAFAQALTKMVEPLLVLVTAELRRVAVGQVHPEAPRRRPPSPGLAGCELCHIRLQLHQRLIARRVVRTRALLCVRTCVQVRWGVEGGSDRARCVACSARSRSRSRSHLRAGPLVDRVDAMHDMPRLAAKQDDVAALEPDRQVGVFRVVLQQKIARVA